MEITLDWITPDPEAQIEKKARICYQSKETENYTKGDMILSLIKNGHDAMLEHACASFTIDGMSRACSHQLVRHRIASYAQKSQRYVKENQFEYVIPTSIENLGRNEVILYHAQMTTIQNMYNLWKQKGVKNEDARFVLPNACTTEIGITTNFREWRNIFKLRCDKHAQWEIREMACNLLKILYTHAPNVFGDLHKQYITEG